jgi:tetratricopeptide (TPR) repeat protein
VSGDRRSLSRSGLWLACAAFSAACSSVNGTERIINGHAVDGPYIEPEAYAAYTEGAYHEARGEWEAAEHAYRTALDEDPGSPGIWLRLGVLSCRTDLTRALDDFRSADTHGDVAQVSVERARCLRQHGQLDAARQAAGRAVQLDPASGSANLLMTALLREGSRPELARHWLFGWLLLAPEVAPHRAELMHEVELLDDAALRALAHERLARLPHEESSDDANLMTPRGPPSRAPEEVLAALRTGDLDAARVRASAVGASFLDLALWAVDNGRPDLAFTQAEIAFEANPHDPNALVLALVAAHLSGNQAGLQRILRQADSDSLPGARLVSALDELLRSRVSDDAAERWRAAYMRLQPSRP